MESRGLYYADRLVSSQKGRDFVNSNYDDIKQVYSIWLCLNAPEASVTRYRYFKEKLAASGVYEIVAPISTSTVILIGVTNEIPEATKDNRMQRLLSILVSDRLTVAQRLALLSDEYGISDLHIEKEVNTMCNLGAALAEDTRRKDAAEVVRNMSASGMSIESILKALSSFDISRTEVEQIVSEEKK